MKCYICNSDGAKKRKRNDGKIYRESFCDKCVKDMIKSGYTIEEENTMNEYLYKVKIVDGKRIYENQHGYVHCMHTGEMVKAVTAWGNTSYVCHRCGEVVSKDLMPTS